MALDPAILALMKETIVIRRRLTDDAYGNPVYDQPVSVLGYVLYTISRSLTTGGETFAEGGTLAYLSEDQPGLMPDAEVTLPDGSQPTLKKISRPMWPDGSRITMLYF